VLGLGSNDVLLLVSVKACYAFQREVIGLRSTAGKNDLLCVSAD
jgi:hypothetical protein